MEKPLEQQLREIREQRNKMFEDIKRDSKIELITVVILAFFGVFLCFF